MHLLLLVEVEKNVIIRIFKKEEKGKVFIALLSHPLLTGLQEFPGYYSTHMECIVLPLLICSMKG